MKKINWERIFCFGVVGLIDVLIDFAFLNLFIHLFHWDPVISGAISFLISITVGFFLNSAFVFKGAPLTLENFIFILVTSSVGLVVNIICMEIFTKGIGWDPNVSKYISVNIVMFWNYLIRVYWYTKRPAKLAAKKAEQEKQD